MPTGGQFAPSAHAESDLTLDAPVESEARSSIVDTDSVFTRRYDSVEEKLKALHDELEARVLGLADDAEWNDYLDTMSRFHRYSFGNQMLIHIQTGGQATQVAGFRKWQEMDRSVMKGEKGIAILAPKRVTVTDKDDNGKPKLDANGKPIKSKRVVGFTTATVFDVSQTDGKPLPEGGNRMLSETPPDGFRDDLETAIAAEGYTVSYEEIGGGANGYTDPVNKRVVVKEGLPAANQAKTLAHELGHIKAGHLDRMDEYHTGHGGQRNSMEVEAESYAYVLTRMNGMSPQVGDYSSRYVAGWGGTDGETVRKSAEHVQKCIKDTIANGSWRNVDD